MSATDADSADSSAGRVVYTRLVGSIADRLLLDPNTGVITVATRNAFFDRETTPGKSKPTPSTQIGPVYGLICANYRTIVSLPLVVFCLLSLGIYKETNRKYR